MYIYIYIYVEREHDCHYYCYSGLALLRAL